MDNGVAIRRKADKVIKNQKRADNEVFSVIRCMDVKPHLENLPMNSQGVKIIARTRQNIQVKVSLTYNEAVALHNACRHLSELQTNAYDRAVAKIREGLETNGGRQVGELFVGE